MLLPRSEAEQGSAESPGKPSEILGPRVGLVPQCDSDPIGLGDRFHHRDGLAVVCGHRKMIGPGVSELEAVDSGNLLSPVHNPFPKPFEGFLPIRPQRGHHLCLTRCGPKRRLSDSGVDDGEPGKAITRVHGTRQRSQVLDQLRHCGGRASALLRICGVRGRAPKLENRSHRPGGKRAALDLNLTGIFSREVVEGKDPIRGDLLESFIIENTQSADTRFLGRLEEQDDSTSSEWMAVQLRGKPGDDRHVSVVPAAVGDSRPARAIVDIVVFPHRHRIDFCTKHDRRTFLTTLKDRSQSKSSKLRHELMRFMRFDEITNDPACLDLFAGKLGVSMELAPQGHQLGLFGRAVHGPQCTPPQ